MILAIVQARMNSSRLPGKVLKTILGKPLIGFCLERLRYCKHIDTIAIGTTTDANDIPLVETIERLGYQALRGHPTDVLDRFYKISQKYNASGIVRVTADCPLIDPAIVDNVIKMYKNSSFEYVSNIRPPSFPDGLDVEVFSPKILKQTWLSAQLPSEREHVTPYMIKILREKIGNVTHTSDLSQLRWTVDYPEDFELVKLVIEHLYPQKCDFQMNDVLKYIEQMPKIYSDINKKFKRNEGYIKSTLDDHAKR